MNDPTAAPDGSGGPALMGEQVRPLLKRCGTGVRIHPMAKIIRPEAIEIDDYSIIDDFTLIAGGEGIRIGRFVHVASFCSIIGGGRLEIGDFAGLSAGCRIITGTDDFSGRSLTNSCVPAAYKPHLRRGSVRIGRHAILGTNTIVHPDVEIGDFSATGSGTIVRRSLPPEGLYLGSPARRVRRRPADELLRLEALLLQEYYGGRPDPAV